MSGISAANIHEHRQIWESDDQWKARSKFILMFKDDYPLNRLLCLAQVYANVETLGCKYPNKVMIEVEGLVKGLKERDVEQDDDVPCYFTSNK